MEPPLQIIPKGRYLNSSIVVEHSILLRHKICAIIKFCLRALDTPAQWFPPSQTLSFEWISYIIPYVTTYGKIYESTYDCIHLTTKVLPFISLLYLSFHIHLYNVVSLANFNEVDVNPNFNTTSNEEMIVGTYGDSLSIYGDRACTHKVQEPPNPCYEFKNNKKL